MGADDGKSALPIQRRRAPAGVPAPLGSFRSSPTGTLRTVQEPVAIEPIVTSAVGRWADYTPTPAGEDRSVHHFVKKASMEGPSLLFPPTPSPTAYPLRYANFGMPMPGQPLPGLPEGGGAPSAPLQQPLQPLQQQQQQLQPLQQQQQLQPLQQQQQQQQHPVAGMMMQGGMMPAGQIVYVQMPGAGGQLQAVQMMPAGVQAGAMMPVGAAMPGWASAEHVTVQGTVEQGARGNSPGTSSVEEQEEQHQEILEPPQDVTHLAGRQLFSEAMDTNYLDRPLAPSQPLPCPGSAPHGTGRCNPCAWFWKAKGCQNGANCTYCHLCPDGELKNRKKAKVAALRMGAIEPAEAKVPGTSNGQQPAALKLTSLI